jgi:hypothetical protein
MGHWEEAVAKEKARRVAQAKEAEARFTELEKELSEKKGFWPGVGLFLIKLWHTGFRGGVRAENILQPELSVPTEGLFAGPLFQIPQSVWDNTIDNFGTQLGLDSESLKILKGFYQPLQGASPIIQGISLLGVYLSIMQFFVTLGIGKTAQALGVKYRPALPGAGEVLGARALTPELDEQIWSVMRRNGYSEEDIKLLLAATYVRLPENTIRDLYFRESRSKEWALKELEHIGYTPLRADMMMASWPIQPTVQDLIYMVGREAFEPRVQAMFGLDSAAPGEYLDYAAKIGYPTFWAQKMWEAHWEHPSLTMVLEMFHRDQLSWEQVYEYMTIVELPPFWREKVKDVAYNVITRVDARRMYGTGTMNDQELFDTYRHMGYAPSDSLRLVDFTIKYESGADRDVAKEDVLRAYAYKDIDRITARGWLEQIGYNTDVSEFYLTQKDLETDRTRTTKTLEVIRDKYTTFLIERPEAQAKMVGLGLSTAAIADQLEGWEISRTKNTKLPSKTDLDKFLRSGIITKGDYRSEMAKLGYSEKYVNWYLEAIQKGLAEEKDEID